MKGHGSKFGRKQEEAIAALLTQRNIEEAAKAIGIVPNTLLKWMRDPQFDSAYREARRAAFQQCNSQASTGKQRGRHHSAEAHGGARYAGVGESTSRR